MTRIDKLRINASKGGKKTALKGKEFLEARATAGGLATLRKYGIDYYSHQLGKKPVATD